MRRVPEALAGETFDLLILGGGITGAGVALDACLRGYRVALIDKGDFAGGTSSVSSKLVHGGLRYLEHGDFHLVYEALHERALLLRNAPHIVRPLRFFIPHYAGARVPAWKFRIGLALYDLLAGQANIARGRPLTRRELLDRTGLRTPGLAGGAAYFDAQMDDARLCIEVLRTAAEHGVVLVNYLEAVAFDSGAVRAIDRLHGGELTVRARQVVNATGPWVDAVCRLAGDTSGPHLQPTKGVHLVVPARGLPAAFLLLHPADGRVFFVIPWMGKTLIGTTDTFGAAPDSLSVTEADVAYLLQGHNHYLEPALNPAAVLGSFAGLRPLIRARPGDPSALSREFRLIESASGLISVAGGKYTTYRRMAEVVTDRVAHRLGRARRCATRQFHLDGTPAGSWADFADRATARIAAAHNLSVATARHLLDRYGRRADEIAAYTRSDPALAQPVVPDEPEIAAEFAYQRDHEMAAQPADFLLRRTRLGLFHPNLLTDPPADVISRCDPAVRG
jgi:glycerol-3-phosphate dehydrogenase